MWCLESQKRVSADWLVLSAYNQMGFLYGFMCLLHNKSVDGILVRTFTVYVNFGLY